jgi:glutaredoxin
MSTRKKRKLLDSGKESKNTYDIITLANCPYCSELIKLLKDKNIKYNNLEIQNNDTTKKNICNLFVKEVFQIEHNTFPKIFVNGKFIGGLDKFSNIFKD